MSHDLLVSIGIGILVIWSLTWKGLALWKSAKNDQPAWFIAVLLINAFGILEIVYLSFFQKKHVCCCEDKTCVPETSH